MATLANVTYNQGGDNGPNVLLNETPRLGAPVESVVLELPATGGAVHVVHPAFTSGFMYVHVVGGDTALYHYKCTGTAAVTLLTASGAAADVVVGTTAVNTGTATAGKVHIAVLNDGRVQVYNAHTGAKTVRVSFR